MSWTRDRKQDDYYGLDTNKPSRDYPGRVYWAYDTGIVYIYAQDSNPYPMGTSTTESALLYPVEHTYANTAEMLGDQVDQTVAYFQYVVDIDTYYEKLETSTANISDYREVTPIEQTIITGSSKAPVPLSYADTTAMYADQKKQIKNYIYRTTGSNFYYHYLGTRNDNATDYVQIGGGVLYALDEGNGIGFVRTDSDRANFGNVGLGSWDFGRSSGVSTLVGATGDYSVNFGLDNQLPGGGNFVFGNTIVDLAGGNYIFGSGLTIPADISSANFIVGSAHVFQNQQGFTASNAVFGFQNTIAGYGNGCFGYLNETSGASATGAAYNLASGYNNYCHGVDNATFGAFLHVSGSYCTAVGNANTTFAENVTGNNNQRRLFIVGNGTANAGARSDAMVVWWEGQIDAPSCTIAEIDAWATGTILTTREWVEQAFTASNGLTLTSGDIELGGTLTQNTTIAGGDNWMTVSSSNAFNPGFRVTKTGGSSAIRAESSGTPTISPIESFIDSTDTNTVLSTLSLERTTTGTAANGIGTGIRFGIENDGGSGIESGNIQVFLTDVTNGSVDSTMRFTVASNNSQVTALDIEGVVISTPLSYKSTSDRLVTNKGYFTDVLSYTSFNYPLLKIQTQYWNGSSYTLTHGVGLGYNALQNNEGSQTIAVGESALNNNTGDQACALGSFAGNNNTGGRAAIIGYLAGYNNTGSNAVIMGRNAGYDNTGTSSIFIGAFAGERNTGSNVSYLGYTCGSQSTGGFSVGVGDGSIRYITANNTTAVGNDTLRYAEGANNTAIGSQAFNTFNDDTANAKNVADASTDVDTVLNRITITAHGFGSNSTYVLLKYTTTGTPIGGLVNTNIYKFLIVDANTIETFEQNLSSVGANTHTFTPQFKYSNSTALGADAEPTASNQVILGNSSVEEVYTAGHIKTHKQVVTDTTTTYNFTLADRNSIVTLNNASPVSAVLPAESSIDYPIGTEITIINLGAGTVTVSVTTDTINQNVGGLTLAQYDKRTAIKVASATWILGY